MSRGTTLHTTETCTSAGTTAHRRKPFHLSRVGVGAPLITPQALKAPRTKLCLGARAQEPESPQSPKSQKRCFGRLTSTYIQPSGVQGGKGVPERNREFSRNFVAFSKRQIRPKFRETFIEIDLRPNLEINFAKFWYSIGQTAIRRLYRYIGGFLPRRLVN